MKLSRKQVDLFWKKYISSTFGLKVQEIVSFYDCDIDDATYSEFEIWLDYLDIELKPSEHNPEFITRFDESELPLVLLRL